MPSRPDPHEGADRCGVVKGSLLSVYGSESRTTSTRLEIAVMSDDEKTELAEHLTQKLYAALNRKNLIQRRPDMEKWTGEFRRLLDEQNPVYVEQVLDWHREHVGEPYTIQAYSAGGFRQKFDKIVHAMNKATSIWRARS